LLSSRKYTDLPYCLRQQSERRQYSLADRIVDKQNLGRLDDSAINGR